MDRIQQLDLFSPAIAASGLYDVAVTPEVTAWLKEGAVAALGLSGGKDSTALALRLAEYLDEIGHKGPRVLIHSDLGVVEWKDSLPVCERLAKRLGWELIVLRRAAGDMMDRWEARWASSLERYSTLSCVKIILPWSTPGMRFCTSVEDGLDLPGTDQAISRAEDPVGDWRAPRRERRALQDADCLAAAEAFRARLPGDELEPDCAVVYAVRL